MVTPVFDFLAEPLGRALSFFFDLIPSYGVAIILLTVLIRVLLLPLTIKQTRSMHAMQAIQPKIKELQAKYKGNRPKLNEELMKVYKENRVNPLGGCLPLLLQLPVFFALYQVLTNGGGTGFLPRGSALAAAIKGGQETFLGMNLACSATGAVARTAGTVAVDCPSSVGARIPFFVMVGLMVFTTFWQQRQMQRASQGAPNPQMAMMTKIMPVFLGFISINLPAGVLVYWVTTNLWQMGQQTIMLRSRVAATGANGPVLAQGKVVKGAVKSQPEKPQGKDKTKDKGKPGTELRPMKAGGTQPRSNGQARKGGSRAGNRKKRRKR